MTTLRPRSTASAIAALLACACLAIAATPADAARLVILDYAARNHPHQPYFTPVCNAKLVGQIMAGDFERVRDKLREFLRHPLRQAPPAALDDDAVSSNREGFYALCLDSEGGDIGEALKINDHLFLNWMRVVEEGRRCISACAMLFMSGGRRDGVFGYDVTVAGRFLHRKATLGFHSPRLEVAAGAASPLLPAEEVAKAYARALRTLAVLIFNRKLSVKDDYNEALLKETQRPGWSAVGAFPNFDFMPPDLLFALVTTPPSGIYSVRTVHEALNWGIELYGLPPPRQITERMLLVACINAVAARCINGGPLQECMDGKLRDARRNVAAAQQLNTNLREPLGEEFFRSVAARYKTEHETRRIAGAIAGLRLETFKMSKRIPQGNARDSPCEIRAAHDGSRLVALDIETFNGRPEAEVLGSERIGRLVRRDDPAQRIALPEGIAVGADHLRPWKMLPARERLADLEAGPWAGLDDDRPFFGR